MLQVKLFIDFFSLNSSPIIPSFGNFFLIIDLINISKDKVIESTMLDSIYVYEGLDPIDTIYYRSYIKDNSSRIDIINRFNYKNLELDAIFNIICIDSLFINLFKNTGNHMSGVNLKLSYNLTNINLKLSAQ